MKLDMILHKIHNNHIHWFAYRNLDIHIIFLMILLIFNYQEYVLAIYCIYIFVFKYIKSVLNETEKCTSPSHFYLKPIKAT